MVATVNIPDHKEAWQMVLGQLRVEMSRADFETWVKPLIPLGFSADDQIFRLAAANDFARKWVENRLDGRISRMLSGLYQKDINLGVVVSNGFYNQQNLQVLQSNPKTPSRKSSQEPVDQPQDKPADDERLDNELDEKPPKSKRKFMLQRAYGSERARIIQPERGMFETNYMWKKWLPLLGHSAYAVVKSARMMCYWNPMTGELRNIVDTDMQDLADDANISVRTLKTVLKNDLIRRYFIRYTVRRVMTPNGIRNAGIRLQVRMDDPLTPEDQEEIGVREDGTWFSPEFEDEDESWD